MTSLPGPSRRDLLRGLAVGAVGGTAGCLGFVYPRVAGRVAAKTLDGVTPSGERERVVRAETDARSVPVEAFRDPFAEGPVTVDAGTLARLLERYESLAYAVTLRLEEPDPVNDVEAGASHEYVVARTAFNQVRPGAAVSGRLARFGDSRLTHVEGMSATGEPLEG